MDIWDHKPVFINTILVERTNGLDPFNIPLHDLISSLDRLGDVSTKDAMLPVGGQHSFGMT